MKHLILALLLLTAPVNALASARGHVTPTPAPIASATPNDGTPLAKGAVSLTCLNCTSSQNAELPVILAKYISVRDGKCFSDFFTSQTKIDENKGLTAQGVVDKLRTTPTKTTVEFYTAWFSKACGSDNANGSVRMKVSCYNAYSRCQRASFFGHEFSHGMGFTHETAGNQASGNEHTPPYLIDEAFTVCCAN